MLEPSVPLTTADVALHNRNMSAASYLRAMQRISKRYWLTVYHRSRQHKAYFGAAIILLSTTALFQLWSSSAVSRGTVSGNEYISAVSSVYEPVVHTTISMCPINHMTDSTYNGLTERWPSTRVDKLDSELYVYGAELSLQTNMLTYVVELIPYQLDDIPSKQWSTATLAKPQLDHWLELQSQKQTEISCVIDNVLYPATIRREQAMETGGEVAHWGVFLDCQMTEEIVSELKQLKPLRPSVQYETLSHDEYDELQSRWQLYGNAREVQLRVDGTFINTHICQRNVVEQNIMLTTKSLFNISADRLENWLDYNLYIGINLITVRDRYGTLRSTISKYNNKFPCQQVRWLPTPLPRRVQESTVRDSVDQVTLLSVDISAHRGIAQWFLSIDVDEYLYVSHPLTHIRTPAPNVCKRTILDEYLTDIQAEYKDSDKQLGAIYIPSVYHNAHGDAVDPSQLGYTFEPQWLQSFPVLFPHRKLRTFWDRTKYFINPSAVTFAQHHVVTLLPQYTAHRMQTVGVDFNSTADSITAVYPRASSSLRTNHYIDAPATSQRVWEFHHLEYVNDVPDTTILDILNKVQRFAHTIKIGQAVKH